MMVTTSRGLNGFPITDDINVDDWFVTWLGIWRSRYAFRSCSSKSVTSEGNATATTVYVSDHFIHLTLT